MSTEPFQLTPAGQHLCGHPISWPRTATSPQIDWMRNYAALRVRDCWLCEHKVATNDLHHRETLIDLGYQKHALNLERGMQPIDAPSSSLQGYIERIRDAHWVFLERVKEVVAEQPNHEAAHTICDMISRFEARFQEWEYANWHARNDWLYLHTAAVHANEIFINGPHTFELVANCDKCLELMLLPSTKNKQPEPQHPVRSDHGPS